MANNNLLIPTSTALTGDGTNVQSLFYDVPYNLPPTSPTLTQQKQAKLSNKTIDKAAKVGPGYLQDVLIGMQDSDSFSTSLHTATRTKIPDSDTYYDGIEGAHYKDGVLQKGIDIVGVDKRTGAYGKSSKVMDQQREYVASIVNKTADTVTEQDFIDVSNQQQIQKLANLGGESAWKAPLIRGVEPTNLTGVYADENGNVVQESLNIPIQTKAFGATGNRDLVAFGDQQGLDVTSIDAVNPQMNIYSNNVTPEGGKYYSMPRLGTDTTADDGTVLGSEFLGSVTRAPQAALAGLFKSGYDAADTTVELGGDLTGKAVGVFDEEAGKAIDKNVDLGTGDEKTADVNALLGYNDEFNKAALKSSGDHYDKAVKDVELFSPSTYSKVDMGEIGSAFSDAFSSPEAAAYSLGYIAPALYGLAERSVVKLFGGALAKHGDDVAKIASNTTATASRKKKAVKALERRLPPKDRVKLFVAKNADAALYGTTMNNDQMDDWIKENGGEEPSLLRMGAGAVLNTLGMKLDMASAKFAIKDSKDLGTTFYNAIKGTSESKAREAMAKVAEYSARLTAAGVTEMPQEFTQSYIEAFNKVYGTDDRGIVDVALDKKVRTDAAKGAIAGAAGGVHMAAGSQVLSDIPSVVKSVAPSTVKAVGKAADAAGGVIDKVMVRGEDTSDSSQDLVKENPGVNPTDIRAAASRQGDVNAELSTESTSDNQDKPISTNVPRNPEAEAAVAKQQAVKEPVASVVDEGDSDAVNAAAEEFDALFSNMLGSFTGVLNTAPEDRAASGLPESEAELVDGMQGGATSAVNALGEAYEKLAAAGAGPNKLARAQKIGGSLLPVIAAADSGTMKEIIDRVGTEQSVTVRSILGSSQVTADEITEFVKATKGLKESEVKLLEAKSSILKTIKNVGEEKINGGGTLPGVNQWMAVLGENKTIDTIARGKIAAFIDSQAKKLNSFKGSLGKWDKANKMPWTAEGRGNKDFRDIDYSSEGRRNDARLHAIRQGDMAATDDPDSVSYGNSVFDDVATMSKMVEVLTKEAVPMGLLADAFASGSEAQGGTKKTQKKSTGKSTPVEATEAPRDSGVSDIDVGHNDEDVQLDYGEDAIEKSKSKPAVDKVEDTTTNMLHGVNLDNLKKADVTWMKNYDRLIKEFRKPTKKQLEKLNRLREESKTPIKKAGKSDKVNRIQEAAEPIIGGSEQEATEAVANEFKASLNADDTTLTQEDVDELDRMHEEDLANTNQKVTGATKVSKATISEMKPEGTDSEPTMGIPKYSEGFKAGLMHIIQTKPLIAKMISNANIDLKDC